MKKKVCLIILFFILAIFILTIVLYINILGKYKDEEQDNTSINKEVDEIYIDSSFNLKHSTTITDNTIITEILNKYEKVYNNLEIDNNYSGYGWDYKLLIYSDDNIAWNLELNNNNVIIHYGEDKETFICNNDYIDKLKQYLCNIVLNDNKNGEISDNLRLIEQSIKEETIYSDCDVSHKWIYKDDFIDKLSFYNNIDKGLLYNIDEEPRIIVFTYDDSTVDNNSVYNELKLFLFDYLGANETNLRIYMQAGVCCNKR